MSQPTFQEERTQQPARVVVGHCPECGEVVIVCNNYECWPPVVCKCGWAGPTFAIAHYTRLHRNGHIESNP